MPRVLAVRVKPLTGGPVPVNTVARVLCGGGVNEIVLDDGGGPRVVVYLPSRGAEAVVKVAFYDRGGSLLAYWDGGRWLIFSDKGMAVPEPLPSLREFRKRGLRVAVVELETEELEGLKRRASVVGVYGRDAVIYVSPRMLL